MAEDNQKTHNLEIGSGVVTSALMMLYVGFAYQAGTRLNEDNITQLVTKTQKLTVAAPKNIPTLMGNKNAKLVP